MCETNNDDNDDNDDNEPVQIDLKTVNEILDLIEFSVVHLRDSTHEIIKHLISQLERVLNLLTEKL